MTHAANAPGFSVSRGEQLTKELIYEVMARQSAAAQLSKLWADTFLTNGGINSGSSTGYTYRGSANYDVIVRQASNPESHTTEDDELQLLDSYAPTEWGLGMWFTASSSYSLSGFILKCKKYGTPTQTIQANLYAVDGSNLPTGAALAQSAVLDASAFTGSFAEVTFTFSTPYTVSNGTKYAIVLERVSGSGSGTNYFAARRDSFGGYANGGAIGKTSGSVWATVGSNDFYFKTIQAAASQAVLKTVTVTMPAAITSALVFVHSSAAVDLVRISTDGGSTWTTVSSTDLSTNTQEGNVINVSSGTSVILEVTFSGSVELEAWGFAGF